MLRIKGTDQGLALSIDCNSRYCMLDPYLGAQHAVAEASRNVSCGGGRPLGFTNCLNFGNPERSPADWQLTNAVSGMADACRELGLPIVSGNVSLYNETEGKPIQPTPMVGCVGVVDDVAMAARVIWNDGDDVYLAGDGPVSLGGSEYLHVVHGRTSGALAPVDFDRERRVQQFAARCAAEGLVSGLHDCAGGGLAVSIAELALNAEVGATVDLAAPGERRDLAWFGEGASRIVVAAAPANRDRLDSLAGEIGVSVLRIGSVGGDSLSLGQSVLSLSSLRQASENALGAAHPETVALP